MGLQITTQEMAERLRKKPRRNDPRREPQCVFDACVKLIYCSQEARNAFIGEYEIQKDKYEKVKVPQNSAIRNSLIKDREFFELLCRMLFSSEDDMTAAALTEIIASIITGSIDSEIRHIGEEMFSDEASKEEEYLAQNILIDTISFQSREVLVYVQKFLDMDLFIEACAGHMELIFLSDRPPAEARDCAAFFSTYLVRSLAKEWGQKDSKLTKNALSRDMLLSSYKNESKFYKACISAAEEYTKIPPANTMIITLPRSDKRLDVMQTHWPRMFEMDNITSGKTEKVRGGGRMLSDKGRQLLENGEQRKRGVSVAEFIGIIFIRLICEEAGTKSAAYENLMRLKITPKAAKEIVNRAFLTAKMIGMDVDRDEPDSRTKQYILTVIANNLLRELLYMQAADLAGNSGRSVIPTSAARKHAKKRYDELLAENGRLKKQLDEKQESSGRHQANNEVKDLKKELAARGKENRRLKAELAKAKEENEELILLFEPEEEEECCAAEKVTEHDVKEALIGRRILVWGCRSDFKRKFDGRFAELQLLDTTDHHIRKLPPAQLAACDGVLIFTNSCSHSMYFGIMRDVKAGKVPYVHMRKSDNSEATFFAGIIKLCESIDRRKDKDATE